VDPRTLDSDEEGEYMPVFCSRDERWVIVVALGKGVKVGKGIEAAGLGAAEPHSESVQALSAEGVAVYINDYSA
jgi:hypothetical protein